MDKILKSAFRFQADYFRFDRKNFQSCRNWKLLYFDCKNIQSDWKEECRSFFFRPLFNRKSKRTRWAITHCVRFLMLLSVQEASAAWTALIFQQPLPRRRQVKGRSARTARFFRISRPGFSYRTGFRSRRHRHSASGSSL